MPPEHPSDRPTREDRYRTRGGLVVNRSITPIAVEAAVEPIIDALDERRGLLLASSYEVPGRYTRWDIGFVDPPLAIETRGRDFSILALNARGRVLLNACAAGLQSLASLATLERGPDALSGTIVAPHGRFAEEDRSRQPSVFSILRALAFEYFASPEDEHLGLYGAFGYDLAFQFEPLEYQLARQADQRDLVLYLPDELVIVDHQRERATLRRYEFEFDHQSTHGLSREGATRAYRAARHVERSCDHAPGEYSAMVRKAQEAFARGDLFEVVPGQTFFEPCEAPPSELFRRLRERNPSPYGFLINLGSDDYLVGASPEMYVRVDQDRVETCPISGTIARGGDAIGDASQILALLNSAKDEAELTMCTDVDRNDKSRVCVPGTVRVIGRRQIEIYSRVIHTVDHVEGRLRTQDGIDALDAFLTHTWAVTVTGAPKAWAMRFLESNERSARAWYGGAIGVVNFNGNMNTGITLRTIRVDHGVAQVRVGATLLYDSDPDEEERETRLKAAAFLDAIRQPRIQGAAASESNLAPATGVRVLLVDHQDSFVHTLANYIRQTGAEVATLRAGFPLAELDALAPDIVVLSPGPGRPSDFDVSATLAACIERGLPVFGVCLGLQGLVEHFGGRLGTLETPVHGKASTIRLVHGGGRLGLFSGLPAVFRAGRYHSLFAIRDELPSVLHVTAETPDGVVMAIEHAELPLAAVQFHPESILSLQDGPIGLRLLRNALTMRAPRELNALESAAARG